MSLLDIEDKYPDDNFWREQGFTSLRNPGIWVWYGPRHLHWNISGTGTRFGFVNIRIIYDKYSKDLEITIGNTSLFGDCDNEVEFEPIILRKPTQTEVEMVLSDEFLSSRLTHKHK